MNPFERQIVGNLTAPGREVVLARDYRSRNLGTTIPKGERGVITRRQGGNAFTETARVLVEWPCGASWHDYGDLDDARAPEPRSGEERT